MRFVAVLFFAVLTMPSLLAQQAQDAPAEKAKPTATRQTSNKDKSKKEPAPATAAAPDKSAESGKKEEPSKSEEATEKEEHFDVTELPPVITHHQITLNGKTLNYTATTGRLPLKREDGKYFLVTPVEKVGIRVDDAPFLAVEMREERDSFGRRLRFRTNVDDWVDCDAAHRLRFKAAADGGLTPYLHVRADLWAKVTRALYYDLVDIGEERMVDGQRMFGVASAGEFFAMADAEQVRGTVSPTSEAGH